jgi:hypothetical protein
MHMMHLLNAPPALHIRQVTHRSSIIDHRSLTAGLTQQYPSYNRQCTMHRHNRLLWAFFVFGRGPRVLYTSRIHRIRIRESESRGGTALGKVQWYIHKWYLGEVVHCSLAPEPRMQNVRIHRWGHGLRIRPGARYVLSFKQKRSCPREHRTIRHPSDQLLGNPV